MKALGFTFFVTLRDACHDWHLTLLSVLAVTAVVLPLFVLLSMRNGILTAISEQLRSDPRLLEVRIIGKSGFSEADLAEIAAWPEVSFLVPRTRFLTSEITLMAEHPNGDQGSVVELVPTADGDPMLRGLPRTPSAPGEIAVSRGVAEALEIEAGDSVLGIVRYEDSRRSERHIERRSLLVVGVLDARFDQNRRAYVTLPFLRNVERFVEGRPVPAWQWLGRVSPESVRSYASFRVFASSMDAVASLQRRLSELRLEPRSRLAEIESFQALDANLTRLVAIIAILAGAGVLLSTAIGQYAAVLRKRRDLCLLMLLGYTPQQVAMMPLMAAAFVAALGVALASLFYAAVDPLIERAFAGHLPPGSAATLMNAADFAAALAVTVAIAVAAASFAALHATRIAPSEGLRDE